MTLFTARTLTTCDVESLKYFCEVLGPRTEKTLALNMAKGSQNAASTEKGVFVQ